MALVTEFMGESQPARSDLAVQQDTILWYFKKTKAWTFPLFIQMKFPIKLRRISPHLFWKRPCWDAGSFA